MVCGVLETREQGGKEREVVGQAGVDMWGGVGNVRREAWLWSRGSSIPVAV